MDKIQIYGILNEDREIVWISDYCLTEFDDMNMLEDAVWKCMMEDNKEMNDLLASGNVQLDTDFVILQTIDKEELEEDIGNIVLRWINFICPKYNQCKMSVDKDGSMLCGYIMHRWEDVMDYKYRQEREWEEEGNV